MDVSAILGALGSVVSLVAPVAVPALTTVGGSAILAALLPVAAPGSRWEWARKLIDLLAANWMHARNASASAP